MGGEEGSGPAERLGSGSPEPLDADPTARPTRFVQCKLAASRLSPGSKPGPSKAHPSPSCKALASAAPVSSADVHVGCSGLVVATPSSASDEAPRLEPSSGPSFSKACTISTTSPSSPGHASSAPEASPL